MNKIKDRWSALSMQQRADLIKLYVESGITNINDIRKDYNSFGDGGNTTNITDASKSGQTPNSKPVSTVKQTTRKIKSAVMDVLQRYQYDSLIESVKNTLYDLKFGTGTKKDYKNNKYEDVAQDSFLFSRKEQKDAFLNSGYIEGTPGDYGLVTKAVGNRDLPVYQSGKDDITRDKLTVIGNLSDMFFGEGELVHAGHFPTTLYKDVEGNVYQKAWDLQDYGPDSTGTGGFYSQYPIIKQIGTKILDMVGNPVVRTTGFRKISDDMLYSLMSQVRDPKLWSELINTKASNIGNDVMENRILTAYDDYLFMKAQELAEKENREFSMEDYNNMKSSVPLDIFKANITKYYDPRALDEAYGIFINQNKFATGGPTEGGWSEESLEKRSRRYRRYDPTGGLGPVTQGLYVLAGGNKAEGEENEYWKAYLGLDNTVPKMNPKAKTSWDDKIEAEKIANGELPSDFYGTTPRMDLNIQAIADTLNTGKIYRNYDEYKKVNPNLPSKKTIKTIYETGKRVLDNPNKWQQIDGDKTAIKKGLELSTNESSPLGMLADFGMLWNPKDKAIYVHDTYDFPKVSRVLVGDRPKEMKIRGKINFDPNKGSKLLRDNMSGFSDYPPPINLKAAGGPNKDTIPIFLNENGDPLKSNFNLTLDYIDQLPSDYPSNYVELADYQVPHSLERNTFDTYTAPYIQGWNAEDIDYLYSRLGDTGFTPKAVMYALGTESSYNPYAKNKVSSAIGLGQLTKGTLKSLYPKDWKDIYDQYINEERSIRDVIDDAVLNLSRINKNITSERDNLGYGRLKINLLAPNALLDNRISGVILKSLTKEQKKKVTNNFTYRDLMNMYQEEFDKKFK